jgi:hypothetical protein
MAPKRCNEINAAGAAATPTSTKRQRVHRPSQSHVAALASLAEARDAARQVLSAVRTKKKAAQKKHKTQMSKANKLDVEDLFTIAEMKGVPLERAHPGSPGSPASSSSSKSSQDPAMAAALHALRDLLAPAAPSAPTPKKVVLAEAEKHD